MITTILKDGTKEHNLPNWIGIQSPGDPMTKTKWRRLDFEYHSINGYSQIVDNRGRVSCTCKGYFFRKNCRHIKEVRP